MTKQEVYDTVKAHLLAQNATARTDSPNARRRICAYRGDNGTKCAVGCLIKDEFYTPELEGKDAGLYQVKAVLELSGIGPEVTSGYFLPDLQSIHDNVHPESWEVHLETLAVRHGLNP